MNRPGFTTRTPAAGMLAAAAASGLILAGCGSTSGSTASSSSSQPAASAASSGSASSGSASSGAASSSPASSGSASSGSASSGSASSVSTGSGSAAFFPLVVGNKWVYVDKLSGEQGTVRNQVISVTPVASGSKVIMKDQDDLGGAPNTTTSALIVHSDGSISVPMTTMGDSFKIKSGSVIWPSATQLASGQPHHDTLVITTTVAGQTSTLRTHVVVKGEGTQTVRVPAGTYQATVIDEVMSEKFSGIAIVMNIRTWVANGVGPVKSEMTSNAAGKIAIVNDQELKSFTKG
jgi:hypothetical protein